MFKFHFIAGIFSWPVLSEKKKKVHLSSFTAEEFFNTDGKEDEACLPFDPENDFVVELDTERKPMPSGIY